jgi:Arc/MetJ family transcription regulator
MATNLDLDHRLVDAAQKLGRHKTKREAFNRALDEYVHWLRQQAILNEFGTIQYDPKYDYKKQRKVA